MSTYAGETFAVAFLMDDTSGCGWNGKGKRRI